MPRLSELMQRPSWIPENGPTEPLEKLQPILGHNLPVDIQRPPASNNIRCPMPVVGTVNPDALQTFYSNTAPKFRVFTSK